MNVQDADVLLVVYSLLESLVTAFDWSADHDFLGMA
jgi:hypothetical protein